MFGVCILGTPNICSFPLDVARKPPIFRMLGVGDSPTPNICSSRRTTDVRGTENGTPNISSTGPKSVPHGEQQMFGVRSQRTGRTPNICSSRRTADVRGPEPRGGPVPKHLFLVTVTESNRCSGSGAPSPKHLPSLSVPLI